MLIREGLLNKNEFKKIESHAREVQKLVFCAYIVHSDRYICEYMCAYVYDCVHACLGTCLCVYMLVCMHPYLHTWM